MEGVKTDQEALRKKSLKTYSWATHRPYYYVATYLQTESTLLRAEFATLVLDWTGLPQIRILYLRTMQPARFLDSWESRERRNINILREIYSQFDRTAAASAKYLVLGSCRAVQCCGG